MTQLIVGEMYEIQPKIIINFGPGSMSRSYYYARFIGYDSENRAVFDDSGKFREITFESNKIFPLRKEIA